MKLCERCAGRPEGCFDDGSCMWEGEPRRTLPMSNRLFARRAAYMASSASKWAADSLDLELDVPVGQETVKRFADEMRRWIEMMERDYEQTGGPTAEETCRE
jgi:hypothetical protein